MVLQRALQGRIAGLPFRVEADAQNSCQRCLIMCRVSPASRIERTFSLGRAGFAVMGYLVGGNTAIQCRMATNHEDGSCHQTVEACNHIPNQAQPVGLHERMTTPQRFRSLLEVPDQAKAAVVLIFSRGSHCTIASQGRLRASASERHSFADARQIPHPAPMPRHLRKHDRDVTSPRSTASLISWLVTDWQIQTYMSQGSVIANRSINEN